MMSECGQKRQALEIDLQDDHGRVLRQVLAAAADHGLDPAVANEIFAIQGSTQRLLGLLSMLSGPIGSLVRRVIAVRGRSLAAALHLMLAPRLLARAVQALEDEAEAELRAIRERDAAAHGASESTGQRLLDDLERVRRYSGTDDMRLRNALLKAFAVTAVLMSSSRVQVPALLATLVV